VKSREVANKRNEKKEREFGGLSSLGKGTRIGVTKGGKTKKAGLKGEKKERTEEFRSLNKYSVLWTRNPERRRRRKCPGEKDATQPRGTHQERREETRSAFGQAKAKRQKACDVASM